MSVEEAYRVLGLSGGASEAEIKAAHQRLIRHLHPDRGGSSFLAAQVNRAKAPSAARVDAERAGVVGSVRVGYRERVFRWPRIARCDIRLPPICHSHHPICIGWTR